MKLREILPPDAEFNAHLADLEVGGVTADSRSVGLAMPSSPSLAARRTACDSSPAAIAAGAIAIVAEQPPQAALPGNVAFMRVHNARRALALMAAKFHPRQPRVIAAVTGTSGKTSVAAFTRQIWTALGYRAASIGTIGVVSPRGETYGSLTTPDPVALHRSLKRSPLTASPISPSKRPRTASTNTGSTACRSLRAVSPISRATISIIIRASRPISPPSFGCSKNCCRPAARQ